MSRCCPRNALRGMPGCLLLVAASAFFTTPVTADVFKCRDSAGKIEFRDQPCAGDARLIEKMGTRSNNKKTSRAEPVAAAARSTPKIVGRWHEDATGEQLTVRANGSFTVDAVQGTATGRWTRDEEGTYSMTATIDGRTLTCEGLVYDEELNLICPNQWPSFYQRM